MQQKHWGKALYTITDSMGSTRPITLSGRNRWTLETLMQRGALGMTPIETPAPRIAAYVHTLKHKYGVDIEPVPERHDGPFAGNHARYVLRSTVTRGAGV